MIVTAFLRLTEWALGFAAGFVFLPAVVLADLRLVWLALVLLLGNLLFALLADSRRVPCRPTLSVPPSRARARPRPAPGRRGRNGPPIGATRHLPLSRTVTKGHPHA
jgi:hypothetical protein